MEQTLVRHFFHNAILTFEFGNHKFFTKHNTKPYVVTQQFRLIEHLFGEPIRYPEKVNNDDLYGYTFESLNAITSAYFKFCLSEWLQAVDNELTFKCISRDDWHDMLIDMAVENIIDDSDYSQTVESALDIQLGNTDWQNYEYMYGKIAGLTYCLIADKPVDQSLKIIEPHWTEADVDGSLFDHAYPHSQMYQNKLKTELEKLLKLNYPDDVFEFKHDDDYFQVCIRNSKYINLVKI